MSSRRRRPLTSIPGLAGGLTMFAVEAAIVIGLLALTWLLALSVLALF